MSRSASCIVYMSADDEISSLPPGVFLFYFFFLRCVRDTCTLSFTTSPGKMGMGVRCSVLCKSLVPVRLKALRPVRHPSATRKVGRWTLAKPAYGPRMADLRLSSKAVVSCSGMSCLLPQMCRQHHAATKAIVTQCWRLDRAAALDQLCGSFFFLFLFP